MSKIKDALRKMDAKTLSLVYLDKKQSIFCVSGRISSKNRDIIDLQNVKIHIEKPGNKIFL